MVYGRATEESQISRKGHFPIVRGNSIRVRRKASWTGCSETSKDGGLSQRSAGLLRSPEASRLQWKRRRSAVSSFHSSPTEDRLGAVERGYVVGGAARWIRGSNGWRTPPRAVFERSIKSWIRTRLAGPLRQGREGKEMTTLRASFNRAETSWFEAPVRRKPRFLYFHRAMESHQRDVICVPLDCSAHSDFPIIRPSQTEPHCDPRNSEELQAPVCDLGPLLRSLNSPSDLLNSLREQHPSRVASLGNIRPPVLPPRCSAAPRPGSFDYISVPEIQGVLSLEVASVRWSTCNDTSTVLTQQ